MNTDNTNPKDHPVMNLAGFDDNPLMAVLQKFEIVKDPSEDPIQNAIQAYNELDYLAKAGQRELRKAKLECARAKVKAFYVERRITEEDQEFYVNAYLQDPEATMAVLNNIRKPELPGGPPILGVGVPGTAHGPKGEYTEEGFMAKLESIKDPGERQRFFRENRNNITR
jgi:hypothetical protein